MPVARPGAAETEPCEASWAQLLMRRDLQSQVLELGAEGLKSTVNQKLPQPLKCGTFGASGNSSHTTL